jgi:hypothetical protein
LVFTELGACLEGGGVERVGLADVEEGELGVLSAAVCIGFDDRGEVGGCRGVVFLFDGRGEIERDDMEVGDGGKVTWGGSSHLPAAGIELGG